MPRRPKKSVTDEPPKPTTGGLEISDAAFEPKMPGRETIQVVDPGHGVDLPVVTLTVDDAILDAITAAVNALNIPATAKIKGLELIEAWIQQAAAFDAQFPTVGVELPFFILLDEYTVIVGVQDRVALDAAGLFGCEWKSTKGTTKFWNEDKWVASMLRGQQMSVYGLAQREGYFWWPRLQDEQTVLALEDVGVPEGNKQLVMAMNGPPLWQPKVRKPRIMIRAITKETPSVIWPTSGPGDAIFEISKARLDDTRAALLNRADAIRTMRLSKRVPWQLTGMHCEDRFSHEMCPFYEIGEAEGCHRGVHPETPEAGGGFSEDDPGSKALKAAESLMHVKLSDPRVVVLSSSSYDDGSKCAEYFRRVTIAGSQINDKTEIQIGTALHMGLACWYNSQKEN
jgi:hypothetical protein